MNDEELEDRPSDEGDEGDEETSLGEREFINWCDTNEIEHSEEDLDEDAREDFVKIKKRFIRAVNDRRLIVDGTKLKYTVSKFSKTAGQELVISRPIGRDFMAMDGFKETQQLQKFHAFIASITKTERSFISSLDITDRQFLQDIATLFLVG
jgi:uncharacterized protein YlxP (DUF503 family)